MSDSIEHFEGEDGQHYFRVKARNGKTVGVSQGYKTRAAAEKGVIALAKAVTFVSDDTEPTAEAEYVETTPEGLDAFADTYGHLLHPSAVPSSATVIGRDRHTLRSLLEAAAGDGWAIIPPTTDEDNDDDE